MFGSIFAGHAEAIQLPHLTLTSVQRSSFALVVLQVNALEVVKG